jgi:hypothetical protein
MEQYHDYEARHECGRKCSWKVFWNSPTGTKETNKCVRRTVFMPGFELFTVHTK